MNKEALDFWKRAVKTYSVIAFATFLASPPLYLRRRSCIEY